MLKEKDICHQHQRMDFLLRIFTHESKKEDNSIFFLEEKDSLKSIQNGGEIQLFIFLIEYQIPINIEFISFNYGNV